MAPSHPPLRNLSAIHTARHSCPARESDHIGDLGAQRKPGSSSIFGQSIEIISPGRCRSCRSTVFKRSEGRPVTDRLEWEASSRSRLRRLDVESYIGIHIQQPAYRNCLVLWSARPSPNQESHEVCESYTSVGDRWEVGIVSSCEDWRDGQFGGVYLKL